MSPVALPDDVAHALADLGLAPTGAIGPSGGWAARGTAGEIVELVVRDGTPDGDRMAALAALRHDHLVPVRAAVALAGGRCGLLVGLRAGPTLATVRHHRVPLTDGEAATVAIPLAQALDALHGAGLAFGPMEANDVVLTHDGMPRLAVPARPFGEPDEDVRAMLAAVLAVMAPRTVTLTTGGHDEAPVGVGLREVFEQMVADGCRSGAEVVRACLGTARPEPIRIPDAVTGEEAREPASAPAPAPALPRPPAGRATTRRAAARRAATRRRTVAVLGAVTLGVAAAVLLRPVDAGLAAEASGAASPGAVPSVAGRSAPVPAPADASPSSVTVPAASAGVADPVHDRTAPARAAAALTRLRAAALGAGDPAGLDAVDVAGGPARQDDGRLLASLDGSRLEGLGADVQDARKLDDTVAPDGDATVVVTAASTPYTLVGPDGSRTTAPGGTPRATALTLRWTDDGWRVWRVSEPPQP